MRRIQTDTKTQATLACLSFQKRRFLLFARVEEVQISPEENRGQVNLEKGDAYSEQSQQSCLLCLKNTLISSWKVMRTASLKQPEVEE